MKALVIGWDCATPELVFNKFLDELPNFRKLLKNATYGRMESCDPPITIPAWMVMATSINPGKLGIYGFRHRKNNSYTDIWISNSLKFKNVPKVWDILGKYGKKSCIVGLPPTYPPLPLNGCMISCFITPDATKDYTYPVELKKEIEKEIGKYIFDVPFRTDEKDELVKNLWEMTQRRHELIKYLIQNKEWDLFWFVEIGLDRVQHAFWRYFDEQHHLHEPNSPYKNVIRDYYKLLDKNLGELLDLIDDDTAVFIVSDHGAKRMKGAFCINEWLIKNKWLVLKEEPKEIVSIGKADVDWNKTKAWGWGGYYARIFFNVKGREENGIISKEEYEKMRKKLAEEIGKARDDRGNVMNTKVFTPEELYPECNGDPPDLMVYFDDLYWRSAGTIGHGRVHLEKNDTGPDDAVHAKHGIFVKYPADEKRIEASIYDFAPTLLHTLGIEIPKHMEGKVIK